LIHQEQQSEALHVTFRSSKTSSRQSARTGQEEIIHLAFRSRRNFPASLQVLMAQQKIQRSHLYLAQEVACTTSMGKKKLAPRRLSFSERRTQNQCERRKKSERARAFATWFVSTFQTANIIRRSSMTPQS
jgi:hypothetical protein